ncbi:MAG: biotin-dependent carboxyltransferase family protein [Acidobacteriia bacterium]|nr:biotin-dependent carboxyltransferase family protein [Terriglobia bacterium]
MPAALEVLKPGLFTTVQDLGRYGYQKYGVSVSGAMDFFSHRVANRLVGNRDDAATLECTILGPTLRFLDDSLISVTGADLSPRLNNEPVEMWKSQHVSKGSELNFGPCRSGCRTYLSIGGGFDVPEVLGSRSTHVRTQLGGLEGRALRKGDVLRHGENRTNSAPRAFESPMVHQILTSKILRILPGPQSDRVEPESLKIFEQQKYRVSTRSDRMGIRFEGASLRHLGGADIVSDALPYGTIQLPADGLPILLTADRQTTGGYPKIAILVTADFPVAGQLKPGDEVKFQGISSIDSTLALRTLEAALNSLPPC